MIVFMCQPFIIILLREIISIILGNILASHPYFRYLHHERDTTLWRRSIEEHNVSYLESVAHTPVDKPIVADEISDAESLMVICSYPVIHFSKC